MDQPKQGDRRNRRLERRTRTQTFSAPGGETLEVSFVSSEYTTEERYCETCGEWKKLAGLLTFFAGWFFCRDCGRDWKGDDA